MVVVSFRLPYKFSSIVFCIDQLVILNYLLYKTMHWIIGFNFYIIVFSDGKFSPYIIVLFVYFDNSCMNSKIFILNKQIIIITSTYLLVFFKQTHLVRKVFSFFWKKRRKGLFIKSKEISIWNSLSKTKHL